MEAMKSSFPTNVPKTTKPKLGGGGKGEISH